VIARVGLRLGLALAAAVAVLAPAQAQTPDGTATLIILDGSGSMWGRLDGEKLAKFYLARDALKTTLGKLKPDARVGFASFGHRRQADCSDIQVLMPPEAEAGGEKLTQFLDKHNPKGKSPLANALREAAKALPKTAGPRSLIVIHDDLDNCNQDPCAALADIQAAAPGVVVHAIGLGLKGEDAQRLQCLVKPTGGRLVDAQNTATAQSAIDEVLTLASLAGAPNLAGGPNLAGSKPAAATAKSVPPTPAPAAAAQAPKPPSVTQRLPLRKDGPSAIRLATLLGPGQLPGDRPVQWTLRRAGETTPVVTATGQDISVAIAAGDYTVDAVDGLLKIGAAKVSIAPSGETGFDVPLTAGVVRTSVNGHVPADGAVLLFEDRGTQPAGRTQAVAAFAAADLPRGIALPPGKWLVRLSEATFTADRTIEVRPGATIDLGGVWPFGRLQITIAGEAIGGSYPTSVTVYEDDPEAPRGRREIARTAAATPELVLPTGTYAIVARQGSIETRDRVVVLSGETVKRTLTLGGGRMTLNSRLAGATSATLAPVDEPVAYRVERLDVVPPQVFVANRQTAELDLPAGRYRVEARHGLVNARAEREVTIAAGQAIAVTLEQQAGTLSLISPQGVSGEMLWEVLDETGHPLWSTAQASPRATLQAGRYTVRLEYRETRRERRVEVRAGEFRLIQMRD
jgi:Ca-activated chloride channel homolog